MDMICRQIAGRSSLTAGDVKNVLTNFLDELPTYMLMNRSVQLEDFGILRISFGSEGVDRAEDFSSFLIRGVKIVFTPSAGEVAANWLAAGCSVELPEIGSLLLEFSSEGFDDPADFRPESLRGVRLRFYPSRQLMKAIKSQLNISLPE